ncbi:MAG: hypothetical protein GX126_08570 [Bacteroidales bacterium]|nr:hypothetical protein [Bacteroidales bacterium]
MKITIIFFMAMSILTSCNNQGTVENAGSVPFEVGTEMVDLTPSVGFPRYGFPSVTSSGVLDPL